MSLNSINADERERIAKERAEKDLKEKKEYLQVFVDSVNGMLDRSDRYNDPVTKHIIFLERILSLFDIAESTSKVIFKDVDELSMKSLDETMNRIKEHVNLLLDWIQQPHYSPDHTYGKHMMELSKHDLDSIMDNNTN